MQHSALVSSNIAESAIVAFSGTVRTGVKLAQFLSSAEEHVFPYLSPGGRLPRLLLLPRKAEGISAEIVLLPL